MALGTPDGEGSAMLVLTRRVNETIMIGDDIAITVVSVQGHGAHAQVRLGITAPREMTVLRREVYEAVRGAAGAGRTGDVPVAPSAASEEGVKP
jgi:carbon storage regulator